MPGYAVRCFLTKGLIPYDRGRVQVAGGNGEQCLSRDIYRLGTQFDFMRLMAWCAPSFR